MRRAWLLVVAVMPVLADTTVSTEIRGRNVTLTRLAGTATDKDPAVIFLPGDGGWRGLAVAMAKTIAGWRYDVYGFDTKRYLEMFSENGRKLSPGEIAADLRKVAGDVSGPGRRRVLLVGWSQGASMAIAAVSGVKARSPIQGVVTLNLPLTGVLGWDWKATMAVVARREPDQPTFTVKPLLGGAAPVPVWMIYGTEDEWTKLDSAKGLFQAASEPKQWVEIAGANHRFDGHQDELFRAMEKGLTWVGSN